MPDPISAIIGSAVIGAGSSLISGAMGADAANKAAKAKGKAADQALTLQKEIFDANKDTIKPWTEAGTMALDKITAGLADGSFDVSKYGMDDLIKDPGYQFRLSEGIKALDRSAASRGNLVSGDQMLAIQDYGQRSASQEFSNAFARTQSERDARFGILKSVSDSGQMAAATTMQNANAFAANASNTITGKGNAQAEGYIGAANAWRGAAEGVATSANVGIENYMTLNRLAA